MKRIITDYLEETTIKFPDKLAVTDGRRALTFAELRAEARRAASELIRRRIFHQPVAILLEQSVESIVSMLGSAYSGNFYTIIDAKMPIPRMKKIFETLEPALVITDKRLAIKCAELQIDCITVDELIARPLDEPLLERTARKINCMDILYVLFTSGSTGVPKGVTIGQRSAMEYTEWVADTFNVDENDIIGNQAPFHFDNSVLDIFQMLKTGATLHIIPRGAFMFPARLLEYIAENRINMIFWVPSILVSVANMDILDEIDVSCLKKILFAGEVMPIKQLNLWRRKLPKALFANLYGPTEITVDCTYYILDREFSDGESLPIGIPCHEGDVLVLNAEDRAVEGTEQGELCVRGSCLSYGYYNNPEKTTEAFVQNPIEDYPELIYRTGDLVHYNERGELMFDGRKDFQIKHMGYRIELGEIETAASSLDGIDEVCCLYDKSAEKIVMCYVGGKAFGELAGRLATLLPRYMLPSRYERLDSMPHNANGKIDRKLLKEQFLED